MEILDMVDHICQLISDDDKYLRHVKGVMLEDVMMLTVKVTGAAEDQLYDIKMEAASIICKAACELMVQKHSHEMFGFEHV